MKKKHYEDFLNEFRYLKNASLIISGDFYEPRLNQEIEEIEKIVNQIDNRVSILIKDVLDEIEENLYDYPESREIYLTNILNDFVDIATYLNTTADKEFYMEFGKQRVKIGNRTYTGSLAVLHETLKIREAWRNYSWDEVSITIPERYAILCFRSFWNFFNKLDEMSTRFNLDLVNIQNPNYIHFFEKLTPSKQIEIDKPEITDKLIYFDSSETIDRLLKELKGYFPEREIELEKALNGEKLKELLLFPHNGNKFVEVFKRAKYNGYVLSTSTEIKTWICSNFKYRYIKGKKIEPKPFSDSTVWDILTKDKDPTKKERICMTEWLPYKSHLLRKREAEQEQL